VRMSRQAAIGYLLSDPTEGGADDPSSDATHPLVASPAASTSSSTRWAISTPPSRRSCRLPPRSRAVMATAVVYPALRPAVCPRRRYEVCRRGRIEREPTAGPRTSRRTARCACATRRKGRRSRRCRARTASTRSASTDGSGGTGAARCVNQTWAR
jgi:hypothetical protein